MQQVAARLDTAGVSLGFILTVDGITIRYDALRLGVEAPKPGPDPDPEGVTP